MWHGTVKDGGAGGSMDLLFNGGREYFLFVFYPLGGAAL